MSEETTGRGDSWPKVWSAKWAVAESISAKVAALAKNPALESTVSLKERLGEVVGRIDADRRTYESQLAELGRPALDMPEVKSAVKVYDDMRAKIAKVMAPLDGARLASMSAAGSALDFLAHPGLKTAAGLDLSKTQAAIASTAALDANVAPMLQAMADLEQVSLSAALAPSLAGTYSNLARGFDAALLAKIAVPEIARYTEQLRDITAPLQEMSERFERWMLPPNLRDATGITSGDVARFVKEGGLPLYAVPRADIAVLLLGAKDAEERLGILEQRANDLVEDCSAVVESVASAVGRDVRPYVLDAISAYRDGHMLSAQAMLTVVFDTLVSFYYPDRFKRAAAFGHDSTNSEVSSELRQMGLMESYVWLPVWHAHLRFHASEGDPVPEVYSRHASVHAAGDNLQYRQGNCLHVMMLVASLIAYSEVCVLVVDEAAS